MRAHMRRFLTASALGAAVSIGFLAAAATASAEPVPPPPPPDPAVVAPDQLTSLNTATITPPASDAPNQVAGGQLPVPANGVPHLASPDSLPPGSTMDPSVMGGDGPNVSYLKDLFHAVQNQEISGKEALLMGLAQRGMRAPPQDRGRQRSSGGHLRRESDLGRRRGRGLARGLPRVCHHAHGGVPGHP